MMSDNCHDIPHQESEYIFPNTLTLLTFVK